AGAARIAAAPVVVGTVIVAAAAAGGRRIVGLALLRGIGALAGGAVGIDVAPHPRPLGDQLGGDQDRHGYPDQRQGHRMGAALSVFRLVGHRCYPARHAASRMPSATDSAARKIPSETTPCSIACGRRGISRRAARNPAIWTNNATTPQIATSARVTLW